MAKYFEGNNTQPTRCRDCGQQLGVGEGVVYSVWDYDWDDPDTDAQGSITVEMERYTICCNATECAERVVERGTNIVALRKVAQNYENCNDELIARARAILAEYSLTMQDLARGADMAARESGYGAIGGHHG